MGSEIIMDLKTTPQSNGQMDPGPEHAYKATYLEYESDSDVEQGVVSSIMNHSAHDISAHGQSEGKTAMGDGPTSSQQEAAAPRTMN